MNVKSTVFWVTFESLVYNATNASSKAMSQEKIWTANSVSDVFLVSQVLAVISASWTNNLTKMMFKVGNHRLMLFPWRTKGLKTSA